MFMFTVHIHVTEHDMWKNIQSSDILYTIGKSGIFFFNWDVILNHTAGVTIFKKSLKPWLPFAVILMENSINVR